MPTLVRIVLADDDPQVRAFLIACLTRMGHKVLAAGCGRTLVARCREARPHLVVSDVDMPGLDGIAAAREIRGFSDVPIILLSGGWDPDREARAAAAGCAPLLSKPVDLHRLEAAVNEVVAK